MPLLMFLDESIRQRLIGVGGYVVRLDELPAVVAAWRALKAEMGLQAGDEIKWTMPADHPTRVKLDASGFTQAKKCPLIANTIAALPIKVLADVLIDERLAARKTDSGGLVLQRVERPVEFYRHAFRWALVWFRNVLVLDGVGETGPHFVVVDQPPNSEKQLVDFDVYADVYRNGVRFPDRNIEALRDLGFMPSVFNGHAKYDDLLQIADSCIGLITEFFQYKLYGAVEGDDVLPAGGYQDDNFRALAPRIRGYADGKLWARGVTAFPTENARVPELQKLLLGEWLYS